MYHLVVLSLGRDLGKVLHVYVVVDTKLHRSLINRLSDVRLAVMQLIGDVGDESVTSIASLGSFI